MPHDERDTRGASSVLALLEQLGDQATDGLMAFDRDLRCLYANQSARRLAGVNGDAWRGGEAVALFPFVAPEHLLVALDGRPAASQGGAFMARSAREERILDGQYFPLYGADGQVIAAAAVIQDVTSRRHAEETLRETESRFRNMADASPVLLWMAGVDGLCTFFNQTWLRFTGRTLQEEWGVGWAESVHFEDFQSCMDTYARAFNMREVFEMEYRLRRHDGEFRWILDRGTPRYTPTGEFAGYIGSCIDITERRVLEAELRSAVQERDEFLSIASHELGTPLTSLRLLVETLLRAQRRLARAHAAKQELRAADARRELDDGEIGEDVQDQGDDESGPLLMVSAIEDQVLRLARLVESLLDVSRLTEGRLELCPEPVDLAALVDRVVGRMTQVAADAGCLVTMDLPGPVHGVWDRVRTEQVVTNLLSNAIKYGAGKPVEITVSADETTARVRVVDFGIGIPAGKQTLIFERYERAAPKNQYGGFGLGLWITRRALEEMGGTIRVQSQEGAGAQFEVALPRRPLDLRPSAAPPPA